MRTSSRTASQHAANCAAPFVLPPPSPERRRSRRARARRRRRSSPSASRCPVRSPTGRLSAPAHRSRRRRPSRRSGRHHAAPQPLAAFRLERCVQTPPSRARACAVHQDRPAGHCPHEPGQPSGDRLPRQSTRPCQPDRRTESSARHLAPGRRRPSRARQAVAVRRGSPARSSAGRSGFPQQA